MNQHDDQFIKMKTASKASYNIAYNITPGKEQLGIFWLSGFLSNMKSTKVSALAKWCYEKNYTLTRFDYSGRGNSEGTLEEGTITQWLEEAKTVFTEKTTGPQIIIGSSMGGWLALLLMNALTHKNKRIAACILIAPAWNMTQTLMWERFSLDIRKEIETNGVYYHPSAYGPYAITKNLIEDGKQHLIHPAQLTPDCPIAILQGMQDQVVPWQHTLKLAKQIKSDQVELNLIKDGDHSLSRTQDMAKLFATLTRVMNKNEKSQNS